MNVFTVTDPIVLGRETENGICTLKFPIAKWITKYGDGGTFHLFNKRSNDENAYPVVITYDREYVYWTPTETDLQFRGAGEAQLDYTFGIRGEPRYRKACSEIFKTTVYRSIEPGANIPEPYVPWITLIESYADRAEHASEEAEGFSNSASLSADEANEYADLAEQFKNDAAGIMGLAVFNIDTDDGTLYITYPEPYSGATFNINSSGYLEVVTNG